MIYFALGFICGAGVIAVYLFGCLLRGEKKMQELQTVVESVKRKVRPESAILFEAQTDEVEALDNVFKQADKEGRDVNLSEVL